MTRGFRNRLGLIMMAMMLLFSSCMTNHGDIGYFYGQWSLMSMTVDSEEAGIDVRSYFWRFQNNIIEMQKVLEAHDYVTMLGSWEEKDNVLYLNFTYGEGENADENLERYNPPSELGIPGREISGLDIEKLTAKDMVLRYVNSQGRTYRYTFKKLL